MTARISLNLGRTGGHRPPLQSKPPGTNPGVRVGVRPSPAGAIDNFIDPRDCNQRDARTLTCWEVFVVFRQIRPLCGLFRRDALLLETADLTPHVAKVSLTGVDLRFVGERVA